MRMRSNKEKLEALLSPQKSGWKAKAEWRAKNRGWLDRSATLAANILQTLRERNLSQKELAEKLGVSPQHVNSILKGTENLTLETIGKLENALGINLITMIRFDQKNESIVRPIWPKQAPQTKTGTIGGFEGFSTSNKKLQEAYG